MELIPPKIYNSEVHHEQKKIPYIPYVSFISFTDIIHDADRMGKPGRKNG